MSRPTHIHIFYSKKIKFLGYRIKKKKKTTSSTKRLLNPQAPSRMWALLWSSLPCWSWQAPFLKHMASESLLLSDWSVRGQGKVQSGEFYPGFWERHTQAHVVFCGLRLMDPLVSNIAPKIAFWTAKGKELISVLRINNLLYVGIWSWVLFKMVLKSKI